MPRQAVSRWECGRTLPDVESLKLIAIYFGVTVDELLDADAQRMIDETADALHTLIMWICAGALYFLDLIVEALIDSFALSALSDAERRGVEPLLIVLRLFAMVWYFVWAFRAEKARRDRSLTSALDIVSFIEGRRPGGSLPNTVFYRLILPFFSFWWTAFLVIVCGSKIVLIFWTRTV
nr:helix-turn-helix transcriptional regulator [Collinsella tanakaei]